VAEPWAQLIEPALDARVREWFQWLHRHPELSFEEGETARFVADRLRELGYRPRERIGSRPDGRPAHGVMAVLGPERPAPALAFRAELDALPLTEASGLPYASEHHGVMHACGHDAHTAILLGAAAALQAQDASAPFPGPIVFLFQPAEEVPPGGAAAMIAAGVLAQPPVGAIFGVHQYPDGDVGTFQIAEGPCCAAVDDFDLTIRGRGGHAAWPQDTIDPVVAAAHAVVALQALVSRQVAPHQAAVLTVGVVNGGRQRNIIPDEVTLQGTVRTLDPPVRDAFPGRLRATASGVCAAFGATAQLSYRRGYEPVINDPAMATLARSAASGVAGAGRVAGGGPTMDGEDFGQYLQHVPGCLVWMGSGSPATPREARPGVHTARFALDPACLAVGVAWHVALAAHYFQHVRYGDGRPATHDAPSHHPHLAGQRPG
jgi:amidohydrolase